MRKILNVLNFILCFSIISCNKKQDDKEYFASGNIKTLKAYDENDKIVKTISYYDLKGEDKKYKVYFHRKDYDSVIVYYNNGKTYRIGKQDKIGNLFGKWDFYTKEGFLSATMEFYIINNKIDHDYRTNQIWFYNKKRDTMYWSRENFNFYDQDEFRDIPFKTERSVFARFSYSPQGDTISIAEPLKAIAEQRFPLMESNGSECYVVIAKEKFNFNKDFSNEKSVKLDTFYCVEKDKVNRERLSNMNQKYTVVFGRWFDTPGKKIIRGYLVEHYKKKPTSNDSIVSEEARIYFEKEIFVKDTI